MAKKKENKEIPSSKNCKLNKDTMIFYIKLPIQFLLHTSKATAKLLVYDILLNVEVLNAGKDNLIW